MKTTNYLQATITILCAIVSLHLQAQYSPSSWNQQSKPSNKQAHHKAAGDTLFYEDFSIQNMTSWSSNSSANPAFMWRWVPSNTRPGGQYSTNSTSLFSTTFSNGYIMLPSDQYNTPTPPNGFSFMHSRITSKAISIKPIVNSRIQFQQSARYCCIPAQLKFEVSTDSLNWTSFPAVNTFPNQVTSNGHLMSIDLGTSIAAEDKVYLRFNQDSASQYFWMIDDVVLTEEEGSGIVLDSVIFDPFRDHGLNQHYSIVPACFTPSYDFKGIAKNYGTNDHTNVRLEVDIVMDSTLNGGPGLRLLASARGNSSSLLARERKVLAVSVNRDSLTYGHYTAYLKLSSDSLNELQNLALDTFSFTLSSDSIYARDYGEFNSTIGPINYHPPQSGDKMGVIFEIDSINYFPISLVTSLSVYIANDSANIGVDISPRAWKIQGDTVSANPLAWSPFSYTIQQIGSWITIPFFPPTGLSAGAYVFGIEQTNSFAAPKGFVLGRDESAETYSWEKTTYIFTNSGSNPHWRQINAIPGIRRNGGYNHACKFVGLSKNEPATQAFVVYPNPSNGEINFTPLLNATTLQIRDLRGRLLEELSLIEGQSRINLQNLRSGIYFLSFDNGEQQIVKKVVIQP